MELEMEYGDVRVWVWSTGIALLLILIYHYYYYYYRHHHFIITKRKLQPLSLSDNSNPNPSASRASEAVVSDEDLKFLILSLEDDDHTDNWDNIVRRSNNSVSYNAKCCKPKDGPMKYLSVTVFEDCSPELLKNFYMDNDYRKGWDRTIAGHEQLQFDTSTGVEIGQTIKKFPLLTAREYVLAWKLWEAQDGAFYCFTKECEHPLAPRQRKYVRVGYFRSGWKITKVPGRNASEIRMFHQEDAGLNAEMAKLAFVKGIWSYVCKMNDALRKYSVAQRTPIAGAVAFIHKVPPGLDASRSIAASSRSAHFSPGGQSSNEVKKKFLRRPSNRALANVLLLGGVICLTRGPSTLGAKVAMAYILTKLGKRGASSSQSLQS